MRIIAGTLKGRRLAGPTWEGLRPTSDRLRETLFNVLRGEVGGARVLDACAGTGALGIEALSRGAAHVTFVEQDARAAALLASNLEHCGIAEGYAIIRADLGSALARLREAPGFDLVLFDPAYDAPDADALIALAGGRLAPGGLLVYEHARRRAAPGRAGPLVRVREIRAGDSALAFYRPAAPDAPGGETES
ncbi:MAG TPA: 16S rRNA (guanine(966)-N(2))-methyltransferase RsmD [Vicinamibacterales bacterium]|nr:16S rRNA (guanine(966)-N(2))-methyltransferase RsmD [Vicinamibacterales bacterium]